MQAQEKGADSNTQSQTPQKTNQRPISAKDDEYLNDRSRCALPLCKISITIGILAVLIALLVGIIRGGGDIHAVSVELVRNNTLLQAKVNDISLALEKQNKQIDQLMNDISSALERQSKQVEQLKNNISVALRKESNQTDQLIRATDRIFNITENTAMKVNDLLKYSSSGNSTNMQILETTKDSVNTLVNVANDLSNIGKISKSTNKVVDDILGVANGLRTQTALSSSLQPISCVDIKRLHPNSRTGYYYVNCQTIYCNMDQLCGSGGGWTRVAYLDMSDATQDCPTGFSSYQIGGKRVCGRPGSNGGSCASAKFFTNHISYSQICGRVEGYAKTSPDALDNGNPQRNNINSYYVDGVSITRGSPRQHVWTFVASVATTISNAYNCPCTSRSVQQVPSFIGDNYYCEAGSADPLWDGQDCFSIETNCCSSPYLPWFYRQYNASTTDYIELRVCCDQNTDDEDVPVGLYEIYIK